MDVRVIGHHDFKRPLVQREDSFKIVPDEVIGAIAFLGFIYLCIFWPYLPR